MSKKIFVFLGWASSPEMYEQIQISGEKIYLDPLDFQKNIELISRIPKFDRFFLGWSMGTLAIFQILNKGIFADKIILLAPTSNFTMDTKPLILKKMINNLTENKKSTVEKFYQNCFYDNNVYVKFTKQFSENIDRFENGSLVNGLNYLIDNKVPLLRNCDISTLAVLGKKDNIVSKNNSMRTLENLSNLDKIILDNCGHNIFYEKEKELNTIVRTYLND